MNVERYEFELYHCNGGEMLVSDTGDYVSYEDYAALEQKLAESQREFRAADATIENLQMQVEKLAAENCQMLRLLTDISQNHDEYVNQDEYLYAGIPMDFVSEINSYVSRDVDAENPFKATDAFLAEVRAQGVEAFANSLKVAGGGEHPYSSVANEFAAQIRKGVQS